jgi:ATP-binding cassette, subfamily F, member 3
VALVGPNGSGKTTFLEILLGHRGETDGKARLGHGVEAAYFSQHEAELDERGSVLDCVQSMTNLSRPKAQTLLGRFLFSGWEAHRKPMTALSGGERRRLALAILVASGANFLVLDEPTNHLDLESREALEEALEGFPGTVLLVSHDRALLDAVAHRTAAVEEGTIHVYEGGWADYIRQREERQVAPRERPTKEKKAKPPSSGQKSRPRPLDEIESRIQAQEALIASLEARLAEDWSDADTIAAHRRAREELGQLLGRWEELLDEVGA